MGRQIMGITKPNRVYILHHVHEFEDGHEDIKLIGIFSTKQKALNVLESYKTLPGFKQNIDGFSVNEYTIDRSGWNEGFVTMD
jgi:hypothetical protein